MGKSARRIVRCASFRIESQSAKFDNSQITTVPQATSALARNPLRCPRQYCRKAFRPRKLGFRYPRTAVVPDVRHAPGKIQAGARTGLTAPFDMRKFPDA